MAQDLMHRPDHHYKPACFVDHPSKVTARNAVSFDQGRWCGSAMTPAVWLKTVNHTPGCLMCERAFRSAELYEASSCSG